MTRSTISLDDTLVRIRRVRRALREVRSDDWSVKVHEVRRSGDAGLARITLTASRGGAVRYRAVNLAVTLGREPDGRTPLVTGRTPRSRDEIRALRFSLGGEAAWRQLSYLVDSCAHFWCADHAPHLYGREGECGSETAS